LKRNPCPQSVQKIQINLTQRCIRRFWNSQLWTHRQKCKSTIDRAKCTCPAHGNLRVDPSATRNLQSSIVNSSRCAHSPMELYTAGGRRWTYTSLQCLKSSLRYRYRTLSLRVHLRACFSACLRAFLNACLRAFLREPCIRGSRVFPGKRLADGIL